MKKKKQYTRSTLYSDQVLSELIAYPTAKPFLKWAGGKRQLLLKFLELYPEALKDGKIHNYFEPFLGSGAVFFDIMRFFKIKKAYLYDVNEELILTWLVIQKDVSKLIEFLKRYEAIYHKLSKKEQFGYYLDLRKNYNYQRLNIDFSKYSDFWIPRAAQFIFLNRTCFNGLYRVNSSGQFNVPPGNYNKPLICNEYNLLAVSKALEIAEIKKADYKQIKRDLRANSFVYFDPPYRPISKTASFTAYTHPAFRDPQQKELKDVFDFINKKDQYVMLSNSDPKNTNPKDNFFDKLYKDYDILRVPAKRLINSDKSKRGIVNEIVVRNYM